MQNLQITFNINDGLAESVCHGYRAGLLKDIDYTNLKQCESNEDIKLHLASTDYGGFLKNLASPFTSNDIKKRASSILEKQFNHFKFDSTGKLGKFLDFISYKYMIDNVLKQIKSLKSYGNQKKVLSKMLKFDPLGMFEGINAITAASTIDEMYELVLVDSPIGPFFAASDKRDFDEYSTIYIREYLNKNYLEAFYDFVCDIGGKTAEIMKKILEFEADSKVIRIVSKTINSSDFKDDRIKLFPNFGTLVDDYPDLVQIQNDEQLKKLLQNGHKDYYNMLNQRDENTSLDLIFHKKKIEMCKDAFTDQFHYACFYAYVELKLQEIKNIFWISSCVQSDNKDRIEENFIPIY